MAVYAARSWRDYFKNEYSYIIKLFYGQFISELTCTHCNKKSITYEPFCYLSLPIPNINNVTLGNYLDHFSENETLDSENKWKCEKCDNLNNASKKNTIMVISKTSNYIFKKI